MRRVSAKATFFWKRIFPIIWYGFLAFFVIGSSVSMAARNDFQPVFLIGPALMAGFGYFLMRFLIFNLVDEVWDAGDTLIVRNRGKEDRIALVNIMNVNYERFSNPSRVTLSLREPCIFGKNVSFAGPHEWFRFRMHPIVSELIERIDAAKRQSKSAN